MPQQYDEVATVYARSLYELAEAAGGQDKVVELYDELLAVVEFARADQVFAEFLASPIIGAARRRDALRSIFDGRISDLLLRFLLVTNEKGRLHHLEAITSAYDALVQEAMGRVEVDVITASDAALGSELAEAVKARVREVLGKEPILHHGFDPTMIGGIKLRIGDQLVDGSVSTRLRRMTEDILGSGGSAVRSESNRFLEDAS